MVDGVCGFLSLSLALCFRNLATYATLFGLPWLEPVIWIWQRWLYSKYISLPWPFTCLLVPASNPDPDFSSFSFPLPSFAHPDVASTSAPLNRRSTCSPRMTSMTPESGREASICGTSTQTGGRARCALDGASTTSRWKTRPKGSRGLIQRQRRTTQRCRRRRHRRRRRNLVSPLLEDLSRRLARQNFSLSPLRPLPLSSLCLIHPLTLLSPKLHPRTFPPLCHHCPSEPSSSTSAGSAGKRTSFSSSTPSTPICLSSPPLDPTTEATTAPFLLPPLLLRSLSLSATVQPESTSRDGATTGGSTPALRAIEAESSSRSAMRAQTSLPFRALRRRSVRLFACSFTHSSSHR
jgi:hypothetical protein